MAENSGANNSDSVSAQVLDPTRLGRQFVLASLLVFAAWTTMLVDSISLCNACRCFLYTDAW